MVWYEGLKIYRNQNLIELAGDNLLGRGLQRVWGDSYKLKKLLGGGAWGVTWLAEYKTNGAKKLFAIKTIKDEILAQAGSPEYEENLAQYLRYFNQEAAALAKCEHEHIVKITERFQLENENNRPCLVMEYVDGYTLWDYVKLQPYKHLGQLEALKYIQQIGNALGEVHRQDLLHHDVKPHNIMIRNPEGYGGECIAKLIDFGTARHFIPQLTQHYSNVLGTQGFAAPEVEAARLKQQQNRGAVAVPIKQAQSIDVYSLAATLYYMVTGAHPLDVPFSDLDQVSPQVKEAILAGMQRNQSDRPATVQEWLQMLPLPRHRVFRMGTDVFEYNLERDGTWDIANRRIKPQSDGVTALDCGNGIKIELVKIPAGSFMMGSNEYDDEKPIHRVNVKEFLMAKYQVTHEQWQAVMGSLPERFIGLDDKFKGNNHPIVRISWDDAQEFCKKLSQKTGRKVKLPSEAQWEYACRAGSTGKYCFGDNEDQLGKYAWYHENSDCKTHPVGEKLANAWGLHDMHGNVWEWCEDVWHENYNGAPVDGSAWLSGGETNLKILRGGSWYCDDQYCRSAYRYRNILVNWYYGIGFRFVSFSDSSPL